MQSNSLRRHAAKVERLDPKPLQDVRTSIELPLSPNQRLEIKLLHLNRVAAA